MPTLTAQQPTITTVVKADPFYACFSLSNPDSLGGREREREREPKIKLSQSELPFPSSFARERG